MPLRILYLKSYDRFDEFLRYEVPSGRFAIIPRSDFLALATEPRFGAFSRAEGRVAGVFASPDGPVLFVDSQQIVARFGTTQAVVERKAGSAMQEFTLVHAGSEERIVLTLQYEERLGLGANPYDNDIEDIDLFAQLANGLCNEKWFRVYTRNW